METENEMAIYSFIRSQVINYQPISILLKDEGGKRGGEGSVRELSEGKSVCQETAHCSPVTL